MPVNPPIVGRAVLIVIDIQKGAFLGAEENGIPMMPAYVENMHRARRVIDAARAAGLPLVFLQEHHRRDMVDYGRELDGAEGVHCRAGDPGTPIAVEETGYREGEDYFVRKRRYSGFFGTDLEILLKGLRAETLILVGGMTDVCVHYTFADAHQHDYHCRVITDSVGGTSDAAHAASLAAMEYLQTGACRSTDEIVAILEEREERAA
ncbi:nicotinamidase-related amidase [Palleronia aestuarii]|uniref:Nicotinamidase-related amidase n=1 Tax=Palleronia aestuarii TaxID=568105 RepID=A0A2W7N039_9RHOB|nr:isochorismatase family cysteine hydrolase [Palleronia aestuarii]PZX13468.1 nicotinamidase-related amidase [Palleronia aestuarii]